MYILKTRVYNKNVFILNSYKKGDDKLRKYTPKELRLKLNMTQSDLGKILNVGKATISSKERGRLSWSAKQIIEFCKLANKKGIKIMPSQIKL